MLRSVVIVNNGFTEIPFYWFILSFYACFLLLTSASISVRLSLLFGGLTSFILNSVSSLGSNLIESSILLR